MAQDTCPAMLMITSSPAPPSASSVTRVWRLSCHRPFTPAFSRTLIHAVLNEVMGRVGSAGSGDPKANTNHSGLHSPNRRVYQAACASMAAMLCYQSKDFSRMTEIAKERGDLLSYTAAKIQTRA